MTSPRILPATLLGLALIARGAWAADDPVPADLPPAAAVVQALAAHPLVRAAQAEVQGAKAELEQLVAGPHEYNLRLTTQQRSVRGAADHGEWSLALERGLRLPGKAELDAQIGSQGVLAAQERVGDARHESARQLLRLWYAARQATLEAKLWQRQVQLYAEQGRIVATRVKRGDAARLELLQADAALAQARAQASAAQARAKTALEELKARYPELPPPDEQEHRPVPPQGDQAAWIEHTLEHNHELLMVQRQLEKARLQTRRSEAERLPDPALGLHLASEQGGNDRILGVTLAVPLPGAARQAQTRQQLAKAEALAEMEAATRRRLSAEAAANWQQAVAGVEAWQRLEEAAQAMSRHAELSRRAHALGELGLAEALLAQRNALEAQLAAGQARLSANEAIARLLLDAHRLWPLGDEAAHHAGPGSK